MFLACESVLFIRLFRLSRQGTGSAKAQSPRGTFAPVLARQPAAVDVRPQAEPEAFGDGIEHAH